MAAFLFSSTGVSCFLIIISVFNSYAQATKLRPEYGVLQVRPSLNTSNVYRFCMWYLPDIFGPLNKTDKYSEFLPLQDLSKWSACTTPPPQDIRDQYIIVKQSSECLLQQQIKTIQEHNGAAVIVLRVDEGVPMIVQNDTLDNETKLVIPVVFIINESYQSFKDHIDFGLEALSYAPPEKSFNLSLIIIWVMAMFTITVGSYWSGRVRYKLHEPQLGKPNRHEEIGDGKDAPKLEDPSMTLTAAAVVMLVIAMCGMLLLLYYFFNYLVYLVMGMYCYASATAIFTCGNGILSRLNCLGLSIYSFDNKCYVGKLRVRHLLILVVAITIPIVWLVFRKASWSWLLQDFLGIFFSIHILRMVRLPSLKICTVLLSLLFVYDIFFVFVTPLFTSSGESVMVEVATGGLGTGGSEPKEQIPLVLKVPYILAGNDPIGELCYSHRYSLLGFGDILVPGLLVSFCYSFDLILNTPYNSMYYIVEVIFYGLGLIVTFFALALMGMAQPALLYLVPFTVFPVVIISLCRREHKVLWYGTIPVRFESEAPSEPAPTEQDQMSLPRYNGTDNPAMEDSDNRTLMEKSLQ